jgi:hypothetical protein
MSKITLNDVGSLIDVTTAQTTINNNFDTIQTAFDNTLSRDGTTPNSMAANLDMNSYRILNLPAPIGNTEPLRLGDAVTIEATGYSFPVPPQHRLTLASGVPFMATSYAAQNTIYSTPAIGNVIPIYNGTYFAPNLLGEMSIVLGSNWTANSNWDVFVASDNGTIRLCTGPAWTNDTTRSAAISQLTGIYVNTNSMTARYSNTDTFTVAAQRGTYLGTIRTGSAGQVNFILGGLGTGGVAANLGVWNAYNRIPTRLFIGDTTSSWTYNVSEVWRAANNSSTIRASILRGLNVDGMTASYIINAAPGSGGLIRAGIGVNSTTSFSGSCSYGDNASSAAILKAQWSGLLGLGYNFISAIESQNTTGTSTWVGSGNGIQSGLHVETWY